MNRFNILESVHIWENTSIPWWRHQMETFSALLWGESTGDRSVTRRLMVSLIRAWTNGWANNREAGGLGRHCTHYGVTLMRWYISDYEARLNKYSHQGSLHDCVQVRCLLCMLIKYIRHLRYVILLSLWTSSTITYFFFNLPMWWHKREFVWSKASFANLSICLLKPLIPYAVLPRLDYSTRTIVLMSCLPIKQAVNNHDINKVTINDWGWVTHICVSKLDLHWFR